MTCLEPYEMFLTLCFIVTKFCFSMSNYLSIQTIFIYSYSSLIFGKFQIIGGDLSPSISIVVTALTLP